MSELRKNRQLVRPHLSLPLDTHRRRHHLHLHLHRLCSAHPANEGYRGTSHLEDDDKQGPVGPNINLEVLTLLVVLGVLQTGDLGDQTGEVVVVGIQDMELARRDKEPDSK